MVWHRYAAIGDSFTEGLEDHSATGRHLGWADRLAQQLATDAPGFQYANLAVRGRKLPEIINDQLPAAIAQGPDLISIAGGVNDVLRPKWSLSDSSELLEAGVVAARSTGADVLLVAFGDPSRRSRTLGTVATRLRQYREVILAIAFDQQCYLMDLYPEELFDDSRLWDEDRLHLNSLGHERTCAAALETLVLGDGSWREPLPLATEVGRHVNIKNDLVWTGRHLAPWIGRRMRRKSSGDEISPKRPTLLPVDVAVS